MELLDIRNADGSLSGQVKARDLVHRDGDAHGVSHVWVVRPNKIGTFDVLLQKRSKDKETYPKVYDVSCAGHLSAGDDYIEAAVREMKEELGLIIKSEDLIFIGINDITICEEFHGVPINDHEISNIYVYVCDVSIDKLRLQKSEVEAVRWFESRKCAQLMKANELPNCIVKEEFQMLMGKVPKIFKSIKEQTVQEANIDLNKKVKCSFAHSCGGCTYQGKSYKEQLKIKQNYIEELFKGHCRVEQIEGMNNPYYYRNKVHAVFGKNKRGEIISGTYKEGTHDIVAVDSCMLEDRKADEIIATIRDIMKKFKIQPYNEDKGTGVIRHVLIRKGFITGQIIVVIVTGQSMFQGKNNFVKELTKEHPEITTIVQNINNKPTSMVLSDEEKIWFGKGYITDVLCGYEFRISSKSFYQINSVQTAKLYEIAIRMAGLTGKEKVIDAYCGIGTIGIIAAKEAESVIGIELNKDAVKDAIVNAKLNRVKNVRFINDDAGRFMVSMAKRKERADVVFMDPPRSGSTVEFLKSVVTLRPNKIVYISCGPDTQLRDVEYLKKHGYKIDRCKPFDMFPFTYHVESVVLMTRCGFEEK